MNNRARTTPFAGLSLPAGMRAPGIALAVASSVLLAALLTPVHTAIAKGGDGVVIQAETDGISTHFTASGDANILTMLVRVIGPEGFVFEQRTSEPSVQWIPQANVLDGIYEWEVRAVTPAPESSGGATLQGQERREHIASGSFRIVNGVLAPSNREQAAPGAPSLTTRIGTAVLDFLFPSAQAQAGAFDDFVTITRDNADPSLALFDPNLDIGAPWWRIRMVEADNSLLEFRYCDFALLGCAQGTEITPLVITRNAGFVGINTRTPISELDVDGTIRSRGQIIASRGTANSASYRFASGIFQENSGLSSPADDTLSLITGGNERIRVSANGNTGFGTAAPTSTIHVARLNDAQLTVENTSTTSAERVPFRLINNGKTRFVINNTGAGSVWTFDNAGESFQISRVGTGEAEFRVFSNGNAEFTGNVTANGVVLSSSRPLKTGFRDIDEAEILDKVSDLDILQWRYKNEDENSSHVGPMAEEFQQLFGLGDGQTLNLVDTTGITLAAIQGLREENRARLAELEVENRALRDRLAEIDEIRAELHALKAAR